MSDAKSSKQERNQRKKEAREAFQKRLDANLIRLCNEANETTKNSPFSLWLLAYYNALQIKYTIYEDDVYTDLKKAIRTKTIDSLPPKHKQLIRRHNLRVRMVSIMDPRSSSIRSNNDEFTNAKELVSLQINSSNSDINDEVNILDIPFKIAVPFNKIEQILKKVHTSNSSGDSSKDIHIGSNKVIYLVNEYFIGIPRIVVREYLKRCRVCQTSKIVTEKQLRRQRFLQSIPEGSLFERVQIDLFFIDEFNEEKDRRVLVPVVQIVDHKSKFRFAQILPSKEADYVVDFLHLVYSIIGPPKILQSDNGKEFINEKLIELNSHWNVQHVHSAPYHPQTNGVVERSNGVLKNVIKKWQISNPDKDWKPYLRFIVHQVNCIQHETLGISPYEYTFGIRSWKEKVLLTNIINDASEIADNEDVGDVASSSDDSIERSTIPPLPVIPNLNLSFSQSLNIPDDIRHQSAAIPDATLFTTLKKSLPTHLSTSTSSAVIPISSNIPLINHRKYDSNYNLIDEVEEYSSTTVVNTQERNDPGSRIDLFGANQGDTEARSFSHRTKADERFRKQTRIIKTAYDKNVVPATFEIGSVVGVVVPKRLRMQLCGSQRCGNIPAKIYNIHRSDGRINYYSVRVKDFKFSNKLNTQEMVALNGGSQAYSFEHSWSIESASIDALKAISLKNYMLNVINRTTEDSEASGIDLTSPSIVSLAQCAACQTDTNVLDMKQCSGCKNLMHISTDQCMKGGRQVPGKGKKAYCNIYCANVSGWYPILPSKDSNESGDILKDDAGASADDDAHSNALTVSTDASVKVSYKRGRNHEENVSLETNDVTAKKVRIKETKTSYYELPMAEYQNVNDFMAEYAKVKHLVKPIRWTNTKLIDLQLFINTWHVPMKDTIDALAKKINTFLKSIQILEPILPSPSQSPLISSNDFPDIACSVSSSSSNNPDSCRVCGELLDELSWHRCYCCKARMHGAVICSKSSRIIVDDDKLYCSIACSKAK